MIFPLHFTRFGECMNEDGTGPLSIEYNEKNLT
jgi:hypothetical protein